MNKNLRLNRVNRAVLSALALPAALWLGQAQAIEGQIGDFDYRLTSTISIGTSVRMQSQDPALYSATNNNEDGTPGRGQSNTSDDGNLNFKKGDAFSTVVKGVHDLDLSRDNYGLFTRVKWFYDHTLNTKRVFHGHEPTSNRKNERLDDSDFHEFAQFDGVNLLDAFGYLNTSIGDKPLDVRVGRQVISWGESTLVLSPISGLNTIDVSAFRRPGADLKEGFTPSEMLYFNLGVTDDTSLESFYQLKWRETVPEGCGTYFSTADFVAEGCDRLAFASPIVFGGGQGPRFDDQQEFQGLTAAAAAAGRSLTVPPLPRVDDDTPSNGGQYGFALRKYASSLDTEFGAYYLNYHNRLPTVNLKAGSFSNQQVGNPLASVAPNAAAPYALGGTNGAGYFIGYPEDVSVFGLSASTNLGGWAVSGELSRAQDVPVQYNANDLLSAALLGLANTGGSARINQKVGTAAPGSKVEGFERFDVNQIQVTGIKTFDRALGSNTIVFVGEVAAIKVEGLPEQTDVRFGRNPVFGSFNAASNPSLDGFVTDFSWGYRMRLRGIYRNVLGNVDLIPGLAWSHDVKGWSPEPGQSFNEGRKSLGLSMGFEFDANTTATVSYTRFSDSADFDVLRDRDFLAASASYSF